MPKFCHKPFSMALIQIFDHLFVPKMQKCHINISSGLFFFIFSIEQNIFKNFHLGNVNKIVGKGRLKLMVKLKNSHTMVCSIRKSK